MTTNDTEPGTNVPKRILAALVKANRLVVADAVRDDRSLHDTTIEANHEAKEAWDEYRDEKVLG